MRTIHRERVNTCPAQLTPREGQLLARQLTGYGPIHLYSTGDGNIAVAVVAACGAEIEVIRTFVGVPDGSTVDHTIYPLGIQEAIRYALGETKDIAPRRKRRPGGSP